MSPQNSPGSYLLTATYDGIRKAACLKLYNPRTRTIRFWYDNTNHLPYCLSDLPVMELEKINDLKNHRGLDHIETVVKRDTLQGRDVEMSKVIAKDPLSIGGRSHKAIREILPSAWEANIRYYLCYLYDKQFLMGMPYRVENGNLTPMDYPPRDDVQGIKSIFKDEPKEFLRYVDDWIQLLQCPIPSIRRVALDLEVYSPVATRVPDPVEAGEPIIATSIADSDGVKRVLLLKRQGVKEGGDSIPLDVRVQYFDDEIEIVNETFRVLREYPLVLTFNGDNFDLRYLYHRAERLGISEEKIPIILGSRFALLKHGVHIDLYRFFFNRSIQIYAFSKKYTRTSLNEVANALLGLEKISSETPISEFSYTKLASYCLRDSELTLKLTTFNEELVMKLIFMLARITHLPMEDLTRQGVSSWIKNLMYYEHRRLNYLIPRSEDILRAKGEASTTAVIKGRKYKGAIVVEPKPGIHFNVAVLDFASLYPSIIKVHNLSYETILCSHPGCRDNQIPELPYWVCRLRRGLSSQIIGSLRDIRVKWYKKKAREISLPASQRSLYNVVQLTLKVLLNASYGVMGAENFGLYCPPVAEAVTAVGRHAITQTVEMANSLGINVLYGDTDSLFLESPRQEQIEDLVKWSNEELKMELEFDKFYRYSVFSRLKKNYLGVYPDGNIEIKGLTGKKRHMPRFLKNAFMEMIGALGEVQSPKDFEAARVKIKEIVRDCHTNVKKRLYPLSDLALHVTVSRSLESYTKTTPQHVKAAWLLVKAGHEVKPGDIISFVKSRDDVGVKPVQLADIKEVDVEKYLEYLRSTFDQVLDAIGISYNEIFGISKLESFLWGPKH